MRIIQQNSKRDSFKKAGYILGSLVRNDIKRQYRNSVLGVLWTVLNPLLNMFVIAFVFTRLMDFGRGENYESYLLAGNIVFGLMRHSTATALTSIVDKFGMVTKVKIPYSILPLTHVVTALVTFGFSYIALIIVMLCYGVGFSWTMFMVVPYLPSLMLFSLGMSFILCTLYVYFRDTVHIYSVILTLWTYLTPLFYYVDRLSGKILLALQFNPMYHYVKYFRDVTLYGIMPPWQESLIIYGIGIGFFLIGFLFFRWRRRDFILHI
jgi:ABC-2 type transport system permease protein